MGHPFASFLTIEPWQAFAGRLEQAGRGRQHDDPGTGTIDFPHIFHATHPNGVDEYLVEHDQPGDPLHTAMVGYQYLANLRF